MYTGEQVIVSEAPCQKFFSAGQPRIEIPTIKDLGGRLKTTDPRTMPSYLVLSLSTEKTPSHFKKVFKHALLENVLPHFCYLNLKRAKTNLVILWV